MTSVRRSGEQVGDPCECGGGPRVRAYYGCAECEAMPKGAGREQDAVVGVNRTYAYTGPLTRGEITTLIDSEFLAQRDGAYSRVATYGGRRRD